MTHSPGHSYGDRELARSVCHDYVFTRHPFVPSAGLLARTLRRLLSGRGYRRLVEVEPSRTAHPELQSSLLEP